MSRFYGSLYIRPIRSDGAQYVAAPLPPVENISVMMISRRGSTVLAVLCTTVVHNAHTYEHFSKLTVCLDFSKDLGLLFVFFAVLFLRCLLLLCYIQPSFFNTKPRDWLGRTSLKWPTDIFSLLQLGANTVKFGGLTLMYCSKDFTKLAIAAFLLEQKPRTSYRKVSIMSVNWHRRICVRKK